MRVGAVVIVRLFASTAMIGDWAGNTIDARSLGSLSSHLSAIQSFTAEQIAAPMDSLTATWPPVSGLQIARLMPNRSNACVRIAARLLPGR